MQSVEQSGGETTSFVRALRAAVEGQNLDELVAKIAAHSGETFTRPALDQWLTGSTKDPSRWKVFAAEKSLDLPPGALSRHLGYLPLDAVPALTPEDAIRQDASLPRLVRQTLLAGIAPHR